MSTDDGGVIRFAPGEVTLDTTTGEFERVPNSGQPSIGDKVTVAYTSPRDGQCVAQVGTLIDGRYPHMYLHLDVEMDSGRTTTVAIPRERVTKVVKW